MRDPRNFVKELLEGTTGEKSYKVMEVGVRANQAGYETGIVYSCSRTDESFV